MIFLELYYNIYFFTLEKQRAKVHFFLRREVCIGKKDVILHSETLILPIINRKRTNIEHYDQYIYITV